MPSPPLESPRPVLDLGSHMRTNVIALVSLLLMSLVVASCSDDEKDTGPSSSPSSTTSGGSETPTDEFAGPLVERPDYSFHLPEGWVDTTDDHMLVEPEDTYAQSGGGTIEDNYSALTISVSTGLPVKDYELGIPQVLNQMRKEKPSAYKRLPDTTWADEQAAHAQGAGLGGKGVAQAFVLIHDGAQYYINLQNLGSRKKNERLLDIIRSSWTWK